LGKGSAQGTSLVLNTWGQGGVGHCLYCYVRLKLLVLQAHELGNIDSLINMDVRRGKQEEICTS